MVGEKNRWTSEPGLDEEANKGRLPATEWQKKRYRPVSDESAVGAHFELIEIKFGVFVGCGHEVVSARDVGRIT